MKSNSKSSVVASLINVPYGFMAVNQFGLYAFLKSGLNMITNIKSFFPEYDSVTSNDDGICAMTLQLIDAQDEMGFKADGFDLLWIYAIKTEKTGLITHVIKDNAIQRVLETDIHSSPGFRPSLFERPFLLQATANKSLFDAYGINEVGGVTVTDTEAGVEYFYLLICFRDHGICFVQFQIDWKSENIIQIGTITSEPSKFDEVAEEVFRFVVTFAYMLEAEGAKLVTTDNVVGIPSKKRRSNKITSTPVYSKPKIYRYVDFVKNTKTSNLRESDHTSGPKIVCQNITDVELRTVKVRGHLRTVLYGEGRKERKTVFVESFESRRWISKREKRISVVN